jgi:hypothetical protein
MSNQQRLTAIGKIPKEVNTTNERARYTPNTIYETYSKPSGFAPFETLFNNFNLQATPVFNFWTEDELTNGSLSLEKGQQLSDLPRYIKLNWRAAPLLSNKTNPGKVTRGSSVKRSKDGQSVIINGAIFSVGHLLPEGFDKQVCNSLISIASIKPGIVASVIDLPSLKEKININPEITIDENALLEDGEFYGIPASDLQSNINQLTQDFTATDWMSERIGTDAQKYKEKYFDGKATVKFPLKDNGKLTIGGVNCASLRVNIAKSNTKQENKSAFLEHLERVTNTSEDSEYDTQTAKVNFVDLNLKGFLKESSERNKQIHNNEAESAIKRILPDIKTIDEAGLNSIRSLDVPSFPSPPGIDELEYAGYIIEKYEQVNGIFNLVSTINLPGREYTEYIDTLVKYNAVYRYRIKSVLRWTRKKDINLNDLTTSNSIQDYNINKVASQTQFMDLYDSSYFGSQWEEKWQYAAVIDNISPSHPDEFSVKPNSHKKYVEVTMKFPDNSQKDICYMEILKKKLGTDKWEAVAAFVFNEKDLKDYKSKYKFDIFLSKGNARYLDYNVDYDTDYAYTSLCYSKHDQYSDYSEQYVVSLNSRYQLKGENIIRMMSCAGVCPDLVGAYSTVPPTRNASELISPIKYGENLDEYTSKVSFSIRETEDKSLRGSTDYFVVAESLDTGEKKDFKFTTKYTPYNYDYR